MFSKLMMCVVAVSMMMVSLPTQAAAAPAKKKPLAFTEFIEPKDLPAEWQARYPKLKVLRASLLSLQKKAKKAEKAATSTEKKAITTGKKADSAELELYRTTNLLKCLLIEQKMRKWNPFLKCPKSKLGKKTKARVRKMYLVDQVLYASMYSLYAIHTKGALTFGVKWRFAMIASKQMAVKYWQELMRALQKEAGLTQDAYALSELKNALKSAKSEIGAAKLLIIAFLEDIKKLSKHLRRVKKDVKKTWRQSQLAVKIRKLLLPLVSLEGAKLRKAYKKRLHKLKPKWRKRVRKKLHSPFL